MQLSTYGLLLLTQPLQSSEQRIRANLEFSSNFVHNVQAYMPETSPIFICTANGSAEQLLASFLVFGIYNFRSIGFFSNAIRLLQMIINTVSTLPSLSELRMCIVEG